MKIFSIKTIAFNTVAAEAVARMIILTVEIAVKSISDINNINDIISKMYI